MTDQHFDAYDRVRQRITALVTSQRHEAAAVPACPGWSVHDVVAHLVGLAEDVISQNTEHYAEPAWTAEQVAARQDIPLPVMLQRWEDVGGALRRSPLPPIGRAFGSLGHLVFVDASIHEHDLRGALGVPDRDNDDVLLSLESSLGLLERVLRRARERAPIPSLSLTISGVGCRTMGDDVGAVSVDANPFELWRGLTGRRTEGQVRALRWDADPAPILPYWAFGPLSVADEPLDY